MKFIIDTSSLISLSRYYLHHDEKSFFYSFLKRKLEVGEIIIIDKVIDECKYFSGGLVLSKLDYLGDKSFLKKFNLPAITENIIAPNHARFLQLTNNEFVNRSYMNSKKIDFTDAEFEAQKKNFLDSADVGQIILCLTLKQTEEVTLVTEETSAANDSKCFHKIPKVCSYVDIPTIPLPSLITYYNINANYSEAKSI